MLRGWYTCTKSDWVSSTWPGALEIRQWLFSWTRTNFSSVVPWLCDEIEYCPLLDSLPSTVPLTWTTVVFLVWCEPLAVSDTGLAVLAIWLNTVTASPGCQARLAAGTRYSRATPWSLAKLALAARKPDTISRGVQLLPGATGIGCR